MENRSRQMHAVPATSNATVAMIAIGRLGFEMVRALGQGASRGGG